MAGALLNLSINGDKPDGGKELIMAVDGAMEQLVRVLDVQDDDLRGVAVKLLHSLVIGDAGDALLRMKTLWNEGVIAAALNILGSAACVEIQEDIIRLVGYMLRHSDDFTKRFIGAAGIEALDRVIVAHTNFIGRTKQPELVGFF